MSVSGSFFLRICCHQDKSSCASLWINENKIVPSYFILKRWSFVVGVLPPQGQKRASHLRKPLTISPQIGKNCSKWGQTHLLQQLATRFLPAFSSFKGFFFIFHFFFFHISHSTSYSSLCYLPFWCHCNSLEVHVICVAAGVKTLICRAWCNAWFDPNCFPAGATPFILISWWWIRVSTVFWDNTWVQVILEGKGREGASGHIIWHNDMFNHSRSCCTCLQLIHNSRALFGFALRSWEISDTRKGYQMPWRWWPAILTQLDVSEKSRDGSSLPELLWVMGNLGWLGGKHSFSITSSQVWMRPRMYHHGCGVWCGPTVYMTLLSNKVAFKDVANCAARLWNYREGKM